MASTVTDTADLLFLLFPNTAILSPVLVLLLLLLSLTWFFPGGPSWALSRARRPPPGPPGFVKALAGAAAHRVLSDLARATNAVPLMSFSVGFTRFVVSSHPHTAKEILTSPAFADRPVKESAYELLFDRAMGFAPFGPYWRGLRRVSATHLFSPRRVAELGAHRGDIGEQMLADVRDRMAANGEVEVKKILHFGSLNNVMISVFGKRFDFGKQEGLELEGLVKEGYELLSVFNWGDHLPFLKWLDLQGVRKRCRNLVQRVDVFVGKIIEEHKVKRKGNRNGGGGFVGKNLGDFVDVLLDLEGEDKLSDADMVAVLWEMIFRGTDTVAILLEWIMARMVLHPDIQSKAQAELDAVVGRGHHVTDADIPSLSYLQAIVKETLRMHPPGPLLSWARLAVNDAHVGGHLVPAGTTAMVNMWSIAHDASVWPEPNAFCPERFAAEDVNVLGSDLRLAPFGAGRRVCPGKALGLATVHLWLAQLLHRFQWAPSGCGIDLSERLNMSLEMEQPLVCTATPRW